MTKGSYIMQADDLRAAILDVLDELCKSDGEYTSIPTGKLIRLRDSLTQIENAKSAPAYPPATPKSLRTHTRVPFD